MSEAVVFCPAGTGKGGVRDCVLGIEAPCNARQNVRIHLETKQSPFSCAPARSRGLLFSTRNPRTFALAAIRQEL
jgi:hypothetical protein